MFMLVCRFVRKTIKNYTSLFFKTQTKQQPRKVLITSALPYVNNVPHLGNVIGCVLSADVYARYRRSINDQVLYVCGTDQYGTATEVKARQENITPKEICDKYFKLHKQAYDWLNIKFDHFGRTSSPEHTQVVCQIFKELDKNGLIGEEESTQHFCQKCDTPLADRYVKGKCPHCQKQTKGDQCDSCNKLQNAIDIIDPLCVMCGSIPILKTVRHLNLKLNTVQPRLKQWLSNRINDWSSNAQSITKDWLSRGLKERSITRSLKWGIPVPKPSFCHLVFYVWFDAPIGYISITKQLLKQKYKEWWYDDTVELYQFMGKDNVHFHSLMFPACIMGSQLPMTTVKHISATEYLLYEGQKFSKSQGVGVFCDSLQQLKISPSVWRYYLLSIRPQTFDSSFEWDSFVTTTNNELLANIGNLFNRVLGLNYSKFRKEKLQIQLNQKANEFLSEVYDKFLTYVDLMDKISLRKALKQATQMSSIGNKWMQQMKPWEKQNISSRHSQNAIGLLLCFLRFLVVIFQPFMPAFSEQATALLGLNKLPLLQDFSQNNKEDFIRTIVNLHRDNTGLPKHRPLVSAISEEDKQSYKQRFRSKI